MRNQTEYKINWEMEVSATSAQDAAREAYDCIKNGSSRVFTVTKLSSGRSKTIDLIELEVQKYKVVKIGRKSNRRKILERGLTEEEAQRCVKRYPNSTRSMVVYMKQK